MSETGPGRERSGLLLEMFGGPVLKRGGHKVKLSPFQLALMTVVFGDGGERTPKSLVERLLWEAGGERGSGGDRAVRHRTSQLVYKTNRRCQARVIEPDGEFLRARAVVVCCDLDDFREKIGASRLREAAKLLERGFLATLPRQTPPALLDWAEEQRLSLRAQLRQKALAGWEASERSQEWTTARQAAEVLLGLAPADETVLRRVMRASAMGGMVREAEAVYYAFAERAEPAGGWVPDPATSELLATVRASASGPGRLLVATTPPELPFVGRSGELARLTRAIEGSDAGRSPATIVVQGVQGIGKTRLVRQALRAARFRGFQVVQACATELERSVPFGSLADALLDEPRLKPVLRRIGDPWRQALLSRLPEWHEELGPPGDPEPGASEPADAALPPGARKPAHGATPSGTTIPDAATSSGPVLSRLLCQAFLRLLEDAARSKPLLLFLDDFHWIDAESVAVVHFVRRRWRAGVLVLVVACRPEELRRNDDAHRLVLEVEATASDAVVALGPIDRPFAFELAKSAAHPSPPSDVLQEVVDLAGGNPLHLAEVAAHNARRAVRLGPGPIKVPESVRRAVSGRVGTLDPVVAKVASALAVRAVPVPLETLSRIAGCKPSACAEALEHLDELGLVGWTKQGFGLVDAVVRHVLYEEMRPARRALLHAVAAQVLVSEAGASGSAGGPPLDQVARHYQRAGDKKRARAYAIEAAEQPAADATNLLRLAYDASRGEERRDVAARLARSYYQARNLKAVRKFGEEALAAREPPSPAHGEVRLIVADARFLAGMDEPEATLGELAKLDHMFSKVGDSAMVLRVLDTALHVMEGADAKGRTDALFRRVRKLASASDFVVRREALSLLTRQAVHGSPEAGLKWGREAARLAQEQGDAMTVLQRLVQALRAAGLLATEEGRATVAQARSMAETTRDVHARGLFLHELAAWHLVAGSRGSAARVLAEFRTLNQANDCPRLRLLELLGHGTLALERGALADARSAFADARSLPAATVARRHVWRLAGLEGRSLLELGRLRTAAVLAEANPLPEASRLQEPSAPAELVLFHARLASRNGDLPGALAILERHLALTDSVGPVCSLRIALEYVRLARRSNRPYGDTAQRARATARALGLQGLAHDFLPFVK